MNPAPARTWRGVCVALTLLLHGAVVWACAICAPADGQNTVLYRLYAADAAVLALAQAPSANVYQVLELVKGTRPQGPITVDQWVDAPPARNTPTPVLLLYNAASRSWRGVGPLGQQRADWLRRLATLQPASVAPVGDWAARLAFFAPDLEHAEAVVATAAYEEIAVAPYAAMRQMRALLAGKPIRRWLDDPALVARLPLYTLLYGVAGAADAEPVVLRQIARLTDAGPPGALSAALAAYLELRGAAGVTWVEDEFLLKPGRSEAQVQAAVLALGVHGGDGVRVPRERVVAAYARLAAGNPAMAGLAASDLANWGHWEFGRAFADILQSGRPLVFASRYAMVFFLLRSPRPDARAAIEALRAANAL